MWDVTTERTVLRLKLNVSYDIACAFRPDGAGFAVSEEGRVRFWTVPTWTEEEAYPGKISAPLGLAFSADGRTLATASVDGVRVHELATRAQRAHLRPRESPSCGLSFSPDGRFLAWVADDRVVQLWDARRDELAKPFGGHDEPIRGLAFTRDGRWLATCSDDSTILVWNPFVAASRHPRPAVLAVPRPWDGLGSLDAAVAYLAMRSLADAPTEAVALFADRLTPAAPIDGVKLAAALDGLDAPAFAARQQAKKAVVAFGPDAVPALERFLATTPSAEARERVEDVLKKFRTDPPDPDGLRQHRSLEVLEWIATREARAVLGWLATGAADAPLTRDATARLARLRR